MDGRLRRRLAPKVGGIVESGAVRVNGRTARLEDKIDPKRDKVTVRGRRLLPARGARYYYIMLHKPRGFITTMSDEMGRKCVAELVPGYPRPALSSRSARP